MVSKPATMLDVARRAGVSKSTVSHVINNTRFVSEETRSVVLAAIEELNFHPSLIARSMSTQQTFTVGLLITDVGNPFYHPLIRGVEDEALAHGYSVFLFNASYDIQRSVKYLHSMIERRVDGVILTTSRMSHELLGEVVRADLPAVVLDWHRFEAPNVGAINFDFEHGMRQAIAHLVELGHRRFAHISGNLELWTARRRRDLFLAILAEYGIHTEQAPVVEGDFSIESGRRALRELLQLAERPTAVLTVNDMTAFGMLFEAKEVGLQIPEDLSVIGVDNIALAAQISPALTTIALPCYDVGRAAMSMLLARIPDQAAPLAPPVHQQVPTELIVRLSTGPCRS